MSSPKASDPILKLKLELKEWERAFAAAHDGRKPSREEVKKNVDIAAKYKEYRKLRVSMDAAPTEVKVQVGIDPISISRQYSREKENTTPRKSTQTLPWNNEIYESPVSVRQRRLFGNQTRDSVGPTPQKNGNVLGLFESFMDDESTPVKRSPNIINNAPTKIIERISVSPVNQDALTTPRKRKIAELDTSTPSKKNNDLEILTTPSFLRRDRARLVDIENSPPIPRPLAPPKRGLSSISAELRDMENHVLDDEEEAMREIESERNGLDKQGGSKPLPVRPSVPLEPELPPPPPGAFSEKGINGLETPPPGGETRVWKKKGLKRQTRRVIMRPVRAKKSDLKPHGEEEDESVADCEEVPGDESGSDYTGSDVDADGHTGPHSKRPKIAANQDISSVKKSPAKTLAEKGKSIVKKAVRKVSATAHANYRRLNIRNKNSKGKGRGGRFSRRR